MDLKIFARIGVAAIAICGIQACGGEPTGQVVAIVNGEEITQQELNAEISELPSPPVGDEKAARRQILQQMVERRLMAQVAKQDGLDKDPTYVIRERRLKEDLLVQMYGKKVADTVRLPGAEAIRTYVSANPEKFSQRTAYIVDQISFDVPKDPASLKRLEQDKTLADVEASLTAMKIEFSKGQNSIDSARVPASVLKQILSLPAGEPFIIPSQGKVVVSVITGRQAVPIGTQDVSPMAAQIIRSENLGKVLKARLDEAKAKANITFQPGFGPVSSSEASKKSPPN